MIMPKNTQSAIVLNTNAQVEAHIMDGYIAVKFSDGTTVCMHPELAAAIGKELTSMSALIIIMNANGEKDER
jgi:hypothetical protein